MIFSKSIPLCFLVLCFFHHSAIGASPLYHFCFSPENYTANSSYGANLNLLFNLLYTKVPPSGFGLGSTGHAQNQVNGLALCRGDVSSQNCNTCVIGASKELRERCPYSKGAIIWYDHCLLKYSDANFFGKIDNKNKFSMTNVQAVENNPTLFNEKVQELLSGLSNEASNANPKFYATGEVQLDTFTTLYGIAQCTRDLSNVDCKKCLDVAISELPNCCDAKRGGRVVGGSCNVGFELYPIVGT
ncbi:cysteine-rich repeat secretory protein 38-like [Prunus avium]|uniref:Cysteine-rich repeat secretory protein 38-like n=1 Tax=Prunus avium TaxID=42229 RepID=A0A6P5RMQ3_PRUAV|nr:cysteine-rich repeat secretory protein 38-like [Prunus avium]